MFKYLLAIFFLCVSSNGFAEPKELLFRDGNLINFAPPVINKQYYLFEFGFMIQKKIKNWDYGYNAFVNASLFEDWKGRTDNLRAGAMGFKGGVMFPLLKKPVFYRVAGGFGKSVLHKNPVFGKDEQSVSKKNLFLFEVGGVYKFDHSFVSLTYQKTNVKFFTRNLFLSFGVNY